MDLMSDSMSASDSANAPVVTNRVSSWTRVVVAAATLVVLAGYAVVLARLGFGHDHVFGFATFFDLNQERNLPTWFSSSLMLACALMLWRIGRQRAAHGDREATYWRLLALGFLFLSLDETGMIHERLAIENRGVLHGSGIFKRGWVFAVALPAVAMVGLAFTRFLRRLPSRTRKRFLLAAAVYLSGVMGFEALAGWVDFEVGQGTAYQGLTLIEETLEIFGIVIFFAEVERTRRLQGGRSGSSDLTLGAVQTRRA
jgi:hypothetical protein